MKRIADEEIKLQLASDDGMSLELYVESNDKDLDESIDYPLLRITADNEDERQYIELTTRGQLVQIPVAAVKSLIEAAEKDVHSESWYENNVDE